MNKASIVEQMNAAADKAASFAIERGLPIPNKSGAWVGQTYIKKNKRGFYDIFSLENQLLFGDIAVFDIAIIISQRYSSGEFKTINKVMELEHVYSKHHTDMLHYLHCLRGAKKRHDYDAMAILEDKFQVSEIRARGVRDNIFIFRRLK